MNTRSKVLLNYLIYFLLSVGFALGCIYFGLFIAKSQKDGFWNAVGDDLLTVFLGVIGGLSTTAFIAYLKSLTKGFRLLNKDARFLTDTWDEEYKADDFPEKSQQQDLCFHIEQLGDRITGYILANDSKDCPEDEKYGSRKFILEGRREGNLVSFIAIIDDEKQIGHTVYLLDISSSGKKLIGQSLYYDLTEHVIASSHCTIKRRSK